MAFAVWKVLLDLFQRNSLMTFLADCHEFYLARIEISKKVITFLSCACQKTEDLKSIDTLATEQLTGMAILGGPPRIFEHLLWQ